MMLPTQCLLPTLPVHSWHAAVSKWLHFCSRESRCHCKKCWMSSVGTLPQRNKWNLAQHPIIWWPSSRQQGNIVWMLESQSKSHWKHFGLTMDPGLHFGNKHEHFISFGNIKCQLSYLTYPSSKNRLVAANGPCSSLSCCTSASCCCTVREHPFPPFVG